MVPSSIAAGGFEENGSRVEGGNDLKVGLIADVHGNAIALKAVLDQLKELDISSVMCMGDRKGRVSLRYVFLPLTVPVHPADPWSTFSFRPRWHQPT